MVYKATTQNPRGPYTLAPAHCASSLGQFHSLGREVHKDAYLQNQDYSGTSCNHFVHRMHVHIITCSTIYLCLKPGIIPQSGLLCMWSYISCIHTPMFVLIHIYIYIHTHTHVCINTYLYIYIYPVGYRDTIGIVCISYGQTYLYIYIYIYILYIL